MKAHSTKAQGYLWLLFVRTLTRRLLVELLNHPGTGLKDLPGAGGLLLLGLLGVLLPGVLEQAHIIGSTDAMLADSEEEVCAS